MADVDAVAEAAKIAERVELAIGGLLYSGWTEVSITRAIDAMSGSFELALAARADGASADLPVKPGDRCEVRVGGETVINGWVDAVAPSIDANAHAIRVSGRDRTADLADCSAIHKPGSWRNVRLEAIAAELAKPFGIKVTAKADTGKPIARFALQQGETVQAALERLLRFRGLLMVADSAGDLTLITPDANAPIATLALGVNILSADATHDHRDRFSTYRVKGQAPGDEHHHGKAVSQLSGTASDAGVARYRPLLIVAEEGSDNGGVTARAKWEAGVRAGRSLSVQVRVLGWRVSAGGALWRPNVQVRVQCPAVQIDDATMLVTAVTFEKSDAGTTATITAMPRGAWQPLAVAEPKK
ncbi:phage baseplate assembly protein [Sphingomonas hengshuiensis]|uniref:phage baseplate assembly protein n=1 Tax=Sphingomonas hengshuiensis TaxID=1609977 RepID=UPI0006981572|nr:contractile injection system protein, VgrG/Pvc8 family [Sphingomonas hengshuiensis]